MSEIEKMYRRYKIKRQQTCRSSDTCYNGSLNECEGCNSYQFPPFTPEKQIKVTLKLWEFRLNIYPDFDLLVNSSYGEIIATFVNNLWPDLTEEEKQQVKGILE